MHDLLVGAESQADAPGPEDGREPTDGELLARFVEHAEKSAFESLIRRHKSMVMGVCRRVLRDEHAAEDAFQATFMVLLRKSKSIGRPELLANWLYGVAFRIARRARIKAGREQVGEAHFEVEAPPEPELQPEWIELKTALDEELSQLPAKHRLPLVLCYLDGKTNIEAARLLGCPDGSIAHRLSLARAELRKRLTRRGMVLSATLLAWLLKHGPASAAVSEGLIKKSLDLTGDFLKHAASAGAAAVPALLKEPEEDRPPTAPDSPVGGPTALPLVNGDLKARRRRFPKISPALFWLLLLSWIAFPIYDLVGASLVRSGGSWSSAARVGLRSGDGIPPGSRDRDVLATGAASNDSNESLRGSDPTADAEREEKSIRWLLVKSLWNRSGPTSNLCSTRH